eukprot:scaffold89225_cov69-Phaeocystis_antarctica.AAC.1
MWVSAGVYRTRSLLKRPRASWARSWGVGSRGTSRVIFCHFSSASFLALYVVVCEQVEQVARSGHDAISRRAQQA